jgi:hypothetical protein
MVNRLEKSWSRGPDLNRGPVDFSRHIVVLVLKAFSLTYHHRTAPYSAAIVRKLFAWDFNQQPSGYENGLKKKTR